MKLGKVTVVWLRRKGACEFQLKKFENLFGKGVEASRENFLTAAREGLSIMWLAWRVLDSRTYNRLANEASRRRIDSQYLFPYQVCLAEAWWALIELQMKRIENAQAR